MAGGGSPAPTKGGKRSVDFNINLVPCIDLLSVLISFLLITAVWTQLARIDAQQQLPKSTNTPVEEPPEEEKKLFIIMEPTQVEVTFGSEPTVTLVPEPGKEGDPVDAGHDPLLTLLRDHMKTVKPKILDPKTQKVAVGAGDAVPYYQIVGMLDILLDNEIKDPPIGDAEMVRAQMPPPPAPTDGVPGAPAVPAPAAPPG